jgi:hypothetical protein
LLQVLADAALAQFLILLTQAGVGLGKGLIVEITLLFEPCHYGGDNCLACLAWLNAGLHQAAQIGFGAHLAAQRPDGVVVEAGFVEEGAGLGGFACEGQLLASSF